ncbi:MCE family protein [candidate division WOR-3 bacterium]|nr:MCE family protein [candidate division WOR-3 bacterium]
MNRPFKAGIFVIVTILIVIVGWMWLSGFEFGKKGYEVTVHFPDATGLKINDPVRVWGVEKGKVKTLEFQKGYVSVKLLLDQDIELYTDAYAAILDVAMISGTKYVKLNPGKSGIPFDIKNPILGKASLGIPLSIIGDLGQKVSNLLQIAEDTDLISSLGSILRNLEETTTRLSQITKDNQTDLRATINNLQSTIYNMGKTVAHTDSILYNIKESKGTLGKLINEDSLYIELHSTLTAIKELVQDIKRNPRRYLKIF